MTIGIVNNYNECNHTSVNGNTTVEAERMRGSKGTRLHKRPYYSNSGANAYCMYIMSFFSPVGTAGLCLICMLWVF